MIYLILVVLVCAIGLWKLWSLQRKQRPSASRIDDFHDSWKRLSDSAPPTKTRRGRSSRSRRTQPLDPQRREAAKRRLEARRRAGDHAGDEPFVG